MADRFPSFLEALGLIPKALKSERKRPLSSTSPFSPGTSPIVFYVTIRRRPASTTGFSNCTHPSERTSPRVGALPSLQFCSQYLE